MQNFSDNKNTLNNLMLAKKRKIIFLIILPALVGSLISVMWAGNHLQNSSVKQIAFEGVYVPYEKAATAPIFREDFPGWAFTDSAGKQHDGTQFYVMARSLFPSEANAEFLDRAQYRWQRPIFPWLARMLYPPGQGTGLLWAFTIIGLTAVFMGAILTGLISTQWKGTPIVALLYPLFPGVFMSLRFGLSDTLALGFLLATLYMLIRNRLGWAAVLATLACLTKESSFITVAGLSAWVLFSGNDPLQHLNWRKAATLFTVPFVTIFSWWLFLKVFLTASNQQVVEFTPPFLGLFNTIRFLGSDASFNLAPISWLLGLGLVVWALKKQGWSHPLTWVVIPNFVFLIFLNHSVIGMSANVTRMFLPTMTFALIMLVTSQAPKVHWNFRYVLRDIKFFGQKIRPAQPIVRR